MLNINAKGKDMNLIEIFENKPFQDVGTFNSIFKLTPILGYPSEVEVEIKELGKDNQRKIIVGNDVIFMDITQKKMIKGARKTVIKKSTQKIEIVEKEFPNIFRVLTPTQFMLYEAIRSVGEVDGIEQLSRATNIQRRTVTNNLKKLIQLGMVKKQIIRNGNFFCKITIDTENNIR